MTNRYLFLLGFLCLWSSCQRRPPATNSFEQNEYTIPQLQKGYASGEYTIQEVVEFYLNQISQMDDQGPELNAIIQVNPEALAIARQLDKELQEGKSRGPLHGIPVVLKDNIDTHDQMETTAGSRALIGSYPLQDSFVAQKLREAGAVILGKANLSEWANFRGELSSSGWSGHGGQTKNPYILDRNPCGSSSGSAVAVSANLTLLAIGTETNGSIVCPSHANGIVGIKPTVGLISRSGIIPISFSQDTPGPMARTLGDAVICLGALTGVDSLDSKTLAGTGRALNDYTPFLKKGGLQGKRIGFYKDPIGINYKVDSLMYQAIGVLKNGGAEIIELEQIRVADPGQAALDLLLFEYKDGLNKYFQSLGPDAPIKSIENLIVFNRSDSIELKYFNQQYLEMAAKMDDLQSDQYQKALKKVQELNRKEGIDKVMDTHQLDAIVAPTGSPAWKTDLINGDSFQLGSSGFAAMAGYPNITLPMGFVEELPVGMSVFGRAWSEPVLIEIAYAYEQLTHYRKPPEFLEE